MNIIPKSQLQTDLDEINEAAKTVTLLLSSCANALNRSYAALWNLPDDRLTEVLQSLYDNGNLYNVFSNPQLMAASINQVLNSVEAQGVRAKDAAPRQFDIISDKVVLQPVLLAEAEMPQPTPKPD